MAICRKMYNMYIYANATHIYPCVHNSIYPDTIFMDIWIYNLSFYIHIDIIHSFRYLLGLGTYLLQTDYNLQAIYTVIHKLTYIVCAVLPTDPHICGPFGKKSLLHPGRQWAVLPLGGKLMSQTRDSQCSLMLGRDVHLVTQVSVFVSCQKTPSLMWASIIWSLLAAGLFKNSENYCSIPRFQNLL